MQKKGKQMSGHIAESGGHGAPTVELSKEEEERMYRQGLRDYVAGNRDTMEANHYISYWVQQDLGETALKALAE